MKKKQRQNDIIKTLRSSQEPVSGTALSEIFKVSRQSIVSDIALLKAAHYNIISTNKGYVIVDPPPKEKVFKVYHSHEEIGDELYTIIDAGGFVKDVFIIHDLYGKIQVNLLLATRADVDKFVTGLEEKKTSPLMKLTGKVHFHTVEAASEGILLAVEKSLQEKGYLIAGQ
ncbi:transcription repressor NadR [Acetobacterium carbinolicum]|uniref:transcription repressor NadR n=1 Tax=Acetobacterium TaxID=33951 RepID=UPI002ACA3B42|nr:transcription repressor NadR [Acetobacterium sp. K1/6]MDZ5725298.1 transcription repressor NadR [Acetobacterium sp. K1/6]